jgi:hypothetical protein
MNGEIRRTRQMNRTSKRRRGKLVAKIQVQWPPPFFAGYLRSLDQKFITHEIMKNSDSSETMRNFFSEYQLRLLIQHAKFGILTFFTGVVLLIVIILFHETNIDKLPEYGWGGIISMPITIICMGIFSVFYEYYIRSTFSKSMRSMYWAWGTGVTVLPSHKDAPDRKGVLNLADNSVKILSTTLSQYFNDVKNKVEEKATDGVTFKIIIYDPDSIAIEEKAKEEGCDPQDFKDEISSVCRRYLGPLSKKFPKLFKVKFCNYNTPFGITIIDHRQMVLSLNIFGLARSKNETPCLVIENKYEHDSVFKLYDESFNAIWNKLDDSVPGSLNKFFLQ